jgi:hypothetical protein
MKTSSPASFALSGLLALGGLGFALCSWSYGKWASEAPSAKEAAPFALPFMLFSTSGASAFLLSAVALSDGLAARRSRKA